MFTFQEKNLTIDYLKSLKKEPKFFGLGFFILEVEEDEELHIWSKDLASPFQHPHTHDHSIFAKVVLGFFRHRICKFYPSDWDGEFLEKVTCFSDGEKQIVTAIGDIVCEEAYSLAKGSTYEMSPGAIHEVEVDCDCITLVKKIKTEITHAKIYLEKYNGVTRAFDKNMPVDQKWNIIEGVLKRENNKIIG